MIVIVQICFAMLLIVPVVWGISNRYKFRGVASSGDRTQIPTLINSSVLYALAFNVIFFLQELFLVLGKKAIGLRSTLYHNNHTWEGENDLAPLMQGSGALGILLVGFLCLGVYRFFGDSKSQWRLMVLWIAFHGFAQSLPQIPIAYMAPDTDLGNALIGYLGMSEILLLTISLLGIVALVFVNIWFGKQLLRFAPEGDDLGNMAVRFKFIRTIAVGAAIIGSVLIVPFRIFPLPHAMTPFLVSAFSIPWIWASVARHGKPSIIGSAINEKIHWVPVVLLVLLLLFFQAVLAQGITF